MKPMPKFAAAAALAIGLGLASADDTKSDPSTVVYKGTWVNRKMGSSGPLQCSVEPGEDDAEWAAVFTGKFKGEGFKYEVKFAATKAGTKTNLKGSAKIDGDPYEWTGAIKGEAFSVKYRSEKGYNGEFTLKRQAAPRK